MFHVFIRLRSVFEGAGEPGIFSVPESRGKLGIFSSLRAYMEETVKTMTSRTSHLASLDSLLTGCIERRKTLGIFPSPIAYIERGGAREFSNDP